MTPTVVVRPALHLQVIAVGLFVPLLVGIGKQTVDSVRTGDPSTGFVDGSGGPMGLAFLWMLTLLMAVALAVSVVVLLRLRATFHYVDGVTYRVLVTHSVPVHRLSSVNLRRARSSNPLAPRSKRFTWRIMLSGTTDAGRVLRVGCGPGFRGSDDALEIIDEWVRQRPYLLDTPEATEFFRARGAVT